MASAPRPNLKNLLYTILLFMIGYITLRLSLAVFIQNQHWNTLKAYSIATSTLTLAAASSIFWGYLNRYINNLKLNLMLGTIATSAGLLIIGHTNQTTQLIALSLYLSGAGLFFVSMNLAINKCTDCARERQQANQFYRLMFNIGSTLGALSLGLTKNISYISIYQMSGLAILLTLFWLHTISFNIQDDRKNIENKNHFTLFFIFTLVVAFIYFSLSYEKVIRILSIAIYTFAISYLIYSSCSKNKPNYLICCLLIILFGLPYWLAVAIVYTQFATLLQSNLSFNFFSLAVSPLLLLMLDGIANIVIGFCMVKLYKKFKWPPFFILFIGLILLGSAFFILAIFINNSIIITAIISIFLYGIAEFLITSTLFAQIGTLIPKSETQAFFLGVLRFGSAFGATLGYYLIHLTNASNINNQNAINLYYYLTGICACSAIIFLLIRKKIDIAYEIK